MNSPSHQSEDITSSFSDRLRSFAYICKRWWLSWLFPGLLASIPTAYVWSLAHHYVDNYNKAVAWTIEREIETNKDCSPEFVNNLWNKGECYDLHRLSTTAWVTEESIRTVFHYWDYTLNRKYGEIHTSFSYPEWQRPGGELKPADLTWLKTTIYTQQGEFFGVLPRYAPNTDNKMHWVPKSYELTPSWWNTSFRQATKFRLSPENLPSDDDIRKLAEQLRKDLNINSRFSIQGNSSPEGLDPSALADRTSPSYNLNQNLAQARAEYVRDRLLQYAPDLWSKIDQVTWVVNLLTLEDIQALQGILVKQWVNLRWNSWIHQLISKYEKWELVLDESDRSIITRIFHRKTIVTHTMKDNWQSEWRNIWSNMDTDMTLWPVALISAMYVLMILITSWIPYSRWLGRAYQDVRWENGNKRKSESEKALTPERKKLLQWVAETMEKFKKSLHEIS